MCFVSILELALELDCSDMLIIHSLQHVIHEYEASNLINCIIDIGIDVIIVFRDVAGDRAILVLRCIISLSFCCGGILFELSIKLNLFIGPSLFVQLKF